MEKIKVVIIGGGFAGINAAKNLNDSKIEVILIDKQNHHLFQPLLYQVATSELTGPDIAAPIRSVFRKQENVKVVLDEVLDIDREVQQVLCRDNTYSYDYLIVATGSTYNYFGKDQWKKDATCLKTLDDAIQIRRKVLTAFEEAEKTEDIKKRRELLTFVVIGGGPTGVELAGALAEMASHTMATDFRTFNPKDARIILAEAGEDLLGYFPKKLSNKARNGLEKLGVEVKTLSYVNDITEDGVHIGSTFIPTKNVMWAAGVKGSPLGEKLKVELHKSGRVPVNRYCALYEDPNTYVVGDLSYFIKDDKAMPTLAPVAIQQGKRVGLNIKRRVNHKPMKEFKYKDRGSLATVGRGIAVGQIKKLNLSGFIAWVVWLFVHISFLIGFRNRAVVMLQWTLSYFSAHRSARIFNNKYRE